jgi:hypothetical protein
VRKNGPKGGERAVGKNNDGESFLLGQQSTFNNSMPGTIVETVVCRDQMIRVSPVYANIVGRVRDHIHDSAQTDWTDQDRKKYHHLELQALKGGPISTDTQLVSKRTRTEVF